MAQIGKKHTQDNDIVCPEPPSDSISCIASSGSQTQQTNAVIAGSWDNTLSCYEITYGQPNPIGIVKRGVLSHDAPVLCCDFASDGMTSFSAGCDGTVRMWNISQPSQSASIIGRHDQPVKALKFLPEINCVVTGSWDKSIRVWDMRSPSAAANIQLSERVYAMDAKGKIVVVGTGDKQVHVFEYSNKIGEFKSPLNFQTRCISIFEDNTGFAMGCIEGRVAIEYYMEIQNKNKPKSATARSFVFKCHRHENDIFSVNAIDFHRYNTFCTAGSDGVFSWWDKDARHRLGQFELHKRRCPITAVKFNPMGNLMFYSLSYDWSKGASFNDPALGNNLVIHPINDAEIKPKPSQNNTLRR